MSKIASKDTKDAENESYFSNENDSIDCIGNFN